MSDVTAWSQVCEEFDDLSRESRRYGLAERFEQLDTDEGRAPERLADWSALRDAIARARDDEDDIGKNPLDEALEWELYHQGISPQEAPRAFVCPDGRCARREEAMFDGPPPCELQRRPMEPM